MVADQRKRTMASLAERVDNLRRCAGVWRYLVERVVGWGRPVDASVGEGGPIGGID